MAHPHIYDLLIQSHHAGRLSQHLELLDEISPGGQFDISLPHSISNLPFLTLLAAQPNSSAAVERLLESHDEDNDDDKSEYYWCCAILGAAMGRQDDCLKMLLEMRISEGLAILGQAYSGHLPLTEPLRGDDLNHAVEGAAWGNQEALLNELLKAGGSIHFAVEGYARAGNERKVRDFLKLGADIVFAIRGAAKGAHDDIGARLFQSELKKFQDDYKALLDAACAEDWAGVEAIIDAGFVMDRIHPKFSYPVIAKLASKPGKMQAVKVLIDKFSHPSWAIFGAAMGCQRELLGYLMQTYPGYKEFAIHGAKKGRHKVLKNELKRLQEDPQFLSVEFDAELKDHCVFNGDYWTYIKNPQEREHSDASSAALGGHRALVHWILHRYVCGTVRPDYSGAVEGATRGGHLSLLMEFSKLHAEWDQGAGPALLVLAAKRQHGSCIRWLLKDESLSAVESRDQKKAKVLNSLFSAADFLSRIHDSDRRASVPHLFGTYCYSSTPVPAPVLTQALPLANIMVRHQLTSPEAKLLSDHAKVLRVLFCERWQPDLLPADVKRKIACYVVGHRASGFGETQMGNVQTTLQNAFMRAKKMCALRQSPENFNGAALHFWIQDCANDLKGQMWPSMQAKGRDLEALLTAIAIPVNTLDAEEMLNALERQNDAGQSIRSLLEPLRYWKDLLSRFPSIAEQVSLPRAEKRLKYAC